MTPTGAVPVNMAQAAASMAQAGWMIFPVHGIHPGGACTCSHPSAPPGTCTKNSPGKHPVESGWQQSATKDPARAFQMLNGPVPLNIGIVTGRASGAVVLDVDGPAGEETLTKFQLPETLMARTGKGRHLFFQNPPSEFKNSTRFLPGLDIRGDGGYVVGPPSLHVSGIRYEWLNNVGIAPFSVLDQIIHGYQDPFERAANLKTPVKLDDQIPEGQRNSILFRWACKLRAQGQEEESIRGELHTINLERCNPPLPQHEVEQVWQSVISRYPAGTVHTEHGHDEYGLVKRVQQTMEGVARVNGKVEIVPCVSTRGNIWGYVNGIYRPINFEGVATLIETWTGEQYINQAGKPKTFRPQIGQTEAVWRHLKALGFIEEFFNEAPSVAGFSNCVLYPDGSTAPHSPHHRLIISRSYPWDPHAQCPGWHRFLEQTFAQCHDGWQRAQALQEFFGAVVFYMATHYEKALLLVGDGANGKSVILDVLSAMVPPNGLVCVAPHDMSQEYRAALLASAHLNVVTELPAGELRDSNAFKAAVDGSSMDGREIREKPFRFRPKGAHAIATNRMPEINDFSYGFQRRWIILETPNMVPLAMRVPKLGRKLLDAEMFGIVAWAVEGAKRLILNRAYTRVPSSDDSAKEWTEDSDQVAVFANEWLKKDGDRLPEKNPPHVISWVPLDVLYNTYKSWAEKIARSGVLSRNKFSRRLAARGFRKAKDDAGNTAFSCVIIPPPTYPAFAVPNFARN